ncbi:MAG: ABC transporter substrate-binding protein [Pseudomonadota bacterium]
MNFDLSRRAFLANGTAVTILAATSVPTFALSESEARRLIDQAVAEINSVINSGQSERAMIGRFEGIFNKYADVSTMARSALGPPARTASSGQIRSFTKAFSGYMARKYGKRFREFIGGSIEVTGARAVRSFQEVTAVAKLRGQSPFAVSFMVSDRSGRDKFFDLRIEGISLLKAERAEIGAMLDRRRGDIDALIGDLQRTG